MTVLPAPGILPAFLRIVKAIGAPDPEEILFEKPRLPEHGDLTTNIALTLAKTLKRKPREIAEEIVERLKSEPEIETGVSRIEVAGPGFINVFLAAEGYIAGLKTILDEGEKFGRSHAGEGKKTQVEFVSANPTGPLTVGHGRGAVYGDTISRLLEWTGHDVTREYYFNNAGRQMRILGDSVRLRYLALLGDKTLFPGDYYQGEYIREIAQHLVDRYGDSLRGEAAEGKFKEQAEAEIFDDIKKTLRRLGIEFAVFYNENSLYETGKVDEVIAELKKRGFAYDRDGAVWFTAQKFGADQDRVIVKSSGEPTYRLPDIAYHREKFRRGFDLVVDVFGADHHATYPDVLAGLKALGHDVEKVKVLIHQFVTIVQDGEIVKMSTRRANFITLDELIDEAGADAVRYFFIMRSIGSHLNFDLGLAKKQSEENPVYYVQYAHARIASILRFAVDSAGDLPEEISAVARTLIEEASTSSIPFNLLTSPEEIDLVKKLTEFPRVVASCANYFEPHRLCEYLKETAEAFHHFYHIHRVVTEDVELSKARLGLCAATKQVLANGFAILGISAPERM